MDADTALAILVALDEAEQSLARIRLHQPGSGKDLLEEHHQLLEQAKHHLEIAHTFA